MFPEWLEWPLRRWVNQAVDFLVVNYADSFEAISNSVLYVLVQIEAVLRSAPWWVIVLVLAGLAYHASRRIGLTLGVVASMILIGSLGLWDLAMQTLALMLVAVGITIVIGIPIGIVMARSVIVRTLVRPILDLMQTMPSFVYLIPAVMLFGLGKFSAVLATVIYAVPPLIRLTDLGIRMVSSDVVESADAFGATGRQKLFGVQMPLALPSIMAGINQSVMMALAMVVIASMIGARGLGEQVLLGLQRLDAGAGAAGGIAIVALAVVLDRLSQAYGERIQKHRHISE